MFKYLVIVIYWVLQAQLTIGRNRDTAHNLVQGVSDQETLLYQWIKIEAKTAAGKIFIFLNGPSPLLGDWLVSMTWRWRWRGPNPWERLLSVLSNVQDAFQVSPTLYPHPLPNPANPPSPGKTSGPASSSRCANRNPSHRYLQWHYTIKTEEPPGRRFPLLLPLLPPSILNLFTSINSPGELGRSPK